MGFALSHMYGSRCIFRRIKKDEDEGKEKCHSKSMMSKETVVYYESIKRELNKRLIFDSRCEARLKAKAEGCTRLVSTM
jgi:hypothetical protein